MKKNKATDTINPFTEWHAKTFQEYYEQKEICFEDWDRFEDCWNAATKAAKEKFTPTNKRTEKRRARGKK